MKLLSAVALSALAFTSCRKDYMCTCTSETRQQNHLYSSSTYTNTYINVTRSEAKKRCQEEEINAISTYIHDCKL